MVYLFCYTAFDVAATSEAIERVVESGRFDFRGDFLIYPPHEVDEVKIEITAEYLPAPPKSYFLVARNNKALTAPLFKSLARYLRDEIPCTLILFENESPF